MVAASRRTGSGWCRRARVSRGPGGFASGGFASAEGGAADESRRVTRLGIRRPVPREDLGQVIGDRLPGFRIPAVGPSDQLLTGAHVNQGRNLFQSQGLHKFALGIAEGEDVLGVRAEERTGIVFFGSDYPRHAAVSLAEFEKNSRSSLENPRTLDFVGIDRHGNKVEQLGLIRQRNRFAADGMEFDVGVQCHGQRR